MTGQSDAASAAPCRRGDSELTSPPDWNVDPIDDLPFRAVEVVLGRGGRTANGLRPDDVAVDAQLEKPVMEQPPRRERTAACSSAKDRAWRMLQRAAPDTRRQVHDVRLWFGAFVAVAVAGQIEDVFGNRRPNPSRMPRSCSLPPCRPDE